MRALAGLLSTTACLPGQPVSAGALLPGALLGSGWVRQRAYSPDGRMLAIRTTVAFQIHDAETGRLLNSVSRPGTVPMALCWSPDSGKLAVYGRDLEIWNPLGSKPERTFALENWVDDLAWSPDGRKIAAGSYFTVTVLSLETGQKSPIRDEHSGTVGSFAWSPDSRQLAIVSGTWKDEAVEFWDVEPRRLARRMPTVHVRPPKCDSDQCWIPGEHRSQLAWSPDGRVLALNSAYVGLSFWDSARATRLKQLAKYGKYWATWSAGIKDSSLPHSPGWSDCFDGKSRSNARGSGSPPSTGRSNYRGCPDDPPYVNIEIAETGDESIWSPDHTKILAKSLHGNAGIWDLASGRELLAFGRPLNLQHDDLQFSAAWSPDGHLLAHIDGSELQLLRAADSRLERSFRLPVFRPGFTYDGVYWSPDARQILARGNKSALISVEDGSVTWLPDIPAFWNPSGRLEQYPAAPGRNFSNFLQSPDRRYVLLRGDPAPDLIVWDLEHNRAVPGIKLQGRLISAAWSPDSRQLARITSPSQHGEVEVWNVDEARIVKRWTAPGSVDLRYLGWGEKLIALDCLGGAVRVWHEP